jgi:peptide/nickel transport system substrate-binding protein
LIGVTGCTGGDDDGGDGGSDGGGGDGGGGDGGDKRIDKTFVSDLQDEPNKFQYNWYNPNRRAHGDESIEEAFWAPLVQYHDGKGEWVADLAEDWEFEQGETFSVTLRDGLEWWNGDQVTARDVYTQFILDKHVYGDDTGKWSFMDEVRVDDERTLTCELSGNINPNIFIENAFHQDPLRTRRDRFEDYVEGYEDASSDSEIESVTQDLVAETHDEPSGYGAWKITDVSSQRLEAEVHEGYWAADNINFTKRRFIPTFWESRPEAQQQALLGGELDGVIQVSAATEDVLEQIPGDPIFPKTPTFNGFGININHNVGHFDDPRVRKAIAFVINHDKQARVSFGHDHLEPARFSGMSNYYVDNYLSGEFKESLTDYTHDVDTAEELLTDAGFTRDGDQWITPEGEQFEHELLTIGERVPWGQNVKDDLQQFGVSIEITTIEPSKFFGVTVPEGDFELALWTASGWQKNHPFGDYESTWIPGNTPWATGAGADLTPEVPWPPGNPDGDPQEVDIEAKVKELGQSTGDREQELVKELAWTYNQTMPHIRLTERHFTAMVSTDEWNAPSADDPDAKVISPILWLPKIGKLTAKE